MYFAHADNSLWISISILSLSSLVETKETKQYRTKTRTIWNGNTHVTEYISWYHPSISSYLCLIYNIIYSLFPHHDVYSIGVIISSSSDVHLRRYHWYPFPWHPPIILGSPSCRIFISFWCNPLPIPIFIGVISSSPIIHLRWCHWYPSSSVSNHHRCVCTQTATSPSIRLVTA